jgi:hypothetical protein
MHRQDHTHQGSKGSVRSIGFKFLRLVVVVLLPPLYGRIMFTLARI